MLASALNLIPINIVKRFALKYVNMEMNLFLTSGQTISLYNDDGGGGSDEDDVYIPPFVI